MTNRASMLTRLTGICGVGVLTCMLAHRYSYVITLASAYERAAVESPDCAHFSMTADNGSFFIFDCRPEDSSDVPDASWNPTAAVDSSTPQC